MHVGRLIHQTFGHQRVQAAFGIYNVRPLKVKKKSTRFTEKLGFSIKHFTNKTVKDTAPQNYTHTKCLCLQMVKQKLV